MTEQNDSMGSKIERRLNSLDLLSDHYDDRGYSRERAREHSKSRPRQGSAARGEPPQQRYSGGAQHAIDAIKESEASKARLYEVSGNSSHLNTSVGHGQNYDSNLMESLSRGFTHSMMVDEQFMFVAAHVDPGVRQKIANGEYVQFLKLISKDKVDASEDQRMELMNREGKPVWIPSSDRDMVNMSPTITLTFWLPSCSAVQHADSALRG